MIITTTNPSNEIINFDSTLHKYYTDDGAVITSATSFIGSFFPTFDTKKISEAYAKKRNLDPIQVRKMWKEKAVKASHLGTQIHEYAQSLFEKVQYKFDDINIANERLVGLKIAAEKAYEILADKYEFIEAEKIVFSIKINVAGTIDLLMYDKKDNSILILDWKTNEAIKRDNFWRNASSPICHLEDCSFNKYQLQLSLYLHILELEDYFPGYTFKQMLIHLEQNRVCWIVVDNMVQEIEDMLEWI